MSFSEPGLLLFLEKTGSWVAGRKPLLDPEPRAGNSLLSGSAQRSSDLKPSLSTYARTVCRDTEQAHSLAEQKDNVNLRTGPER